MKNTKYKYIVRHDGSYTHVETVNPDSMRAKYGVAFDNFSDAKKEALKILRDIRDDYKYAVERMHSTTKQECIDEWGG